jgi:ATP-dependent DNA ligase
MALPISPPYPPREALFVDKIPEGREWQYEPKWDGFPLAFMEQVIPNGGVRRRGYSRKISQR